MQGANPSELRAVIQRLVFEFRSLGEDEGTDDPWEGAGVPRGYTDVSEQVEVRGCELLNADEDAGPVKVLFDGSKPSALDAANSEGAAQGKDWVQSGADDQLLLFVPFQSSIKLHTLQVSESIHYSWLWFLEPGRGTGGGGSRAGVPPPLSP